MSASYEKSDACYTMDVGRVGRHARRVGRAARGGSVAAVQAEIPLARAEKGTLRRKTLPRVLRRGFFFCIGVFLLKLALLIAGG